MMNSTLDGVSFTVVYGRVELRTRLRPEGDKLIGVGRAWHYDENDVLIKDTGWEPTGSVLWWPTITGGFGEL